MSTLDIATPAPAPAPAVARTETRTRPAWLFVVCLATAAYLVVELAFNARLLDVVGGGATPEEIDRIEIWGRAISGFALALVCWPWLIKRGTTRRATLLGHAWRLTWCSAVFIVGMYAFQEALLRTLVDNSSSAELRTAQHLVLLQSGLVHEVAIVDSLDLTPERLETPEGKATLALLPMLASHMDDVGDRFTDEQRAKVAADVARSMMGDVDDRKSDYDHLRKALDDIYRPFEQSGARSSSPLWHPIRQVMALDGVSTLPGTYEDFIRDPELQGVMLRTLGYGCIKTANFEVYRPASVKKEFWDREVQCIADRQMLDDGDLEAGRDAQRALLVPFMALGFSLLGALAHMAKLTLYLLTVAVGYPLFRNKWGFAAVTVVLPASLLTGFAWTMSSEPTSSTAFQGMERETDAVMRTMIRGTIHGQMVGYPVFEAVRVNLLNGFDFGYTGGDTTSNPDSAATK
ncbi:MAG: hypothetical protein ACRER5_02935 [Pseudomonas sp.]